jgi:GAF domain-containing protein
MTAHDDGLPLPGIGQLARLTEIARLGLAEMSSDPELQGIVSRAAQRISLPIALVSIVLDGAQHFVAQHGLEGWLKATAGTPSEWAFCVHAVQSKRPFVVEDAQIHPLVQQNPLVANDGVRAYLGAPLITRSGHAVGTLCVLGSQPRTFSDADVTGLEELARELMTVIEARVKE